MHETDVTLVRPGAWGSEAAFFSPSVIESRLEFAIRAAREAGQLTLDWFKRPGRSGSDISLQTKSDGSPVTIADKAAERLIRDLISRECPGDGVLGEEYDDIEAELGGGGTAEVGLRWVIDPIDGTFSFARGVPLYGTLLAAEPVGEGGRVLGPPELGVIYMPGLDEMVYAGRGLGAWHRLGDGEAERARVSETPEVGASCVAATSWDYFRWAGVEQSMDRLVRSVAYSRGFPDAYAWALVATGRVDFVVEPKMAAWDVGPVLPVLIEAGGVFTDWNGRVTVHGGNAVGSNGALHEQALRVVRGEDG